MRSFLKSKSGFSIIVIGIIVTWSLFNIKPWQQRKVIQWDVTSYYGYLPAAFIEKDLTLSFISKDSVGFKERMEYWPSQTVDGKLIFKTTMGNAILYSPFFFAAHIFQWATGGDTSGFSPAYHFSVALCTLFYLLVGLLFLRRFLLDFFDDWIVAVTLFAIVIGTNLLYYVSSEPGLSHPFSFALLSVYLYFGSKWIRSGTWQSLFVVAFLAGLLFLIRPINLLSLFSIFLLYVKGITDLKLRLNLLIERKSQLLVFALIAFLVLFPQLLYLKIYGGNWLLNSYVGERFYFDNPHIFDGFFSYRKGLLIYTPLMLFSFVGYFLLFKRKSPFKLFLLFFLPVFSYVVFSWWCWWYGGGFGQRSWIDIYPFMAVLFAIFLKFISERSRVIFLSGIVIVLLTISFTIFDTLKYRYLSIHFDSMTKEAYWKCFMKLKPDDDFENYLRSPDYEKAKLGIDEY